VWAIKNQEKLMGFVQFVIIKIVGVDYKMEKTNFKGALTKDITHRISLKDIIKEREADQKRMKEVMAKHKIKMDYKKASAKGWVKCPNTSWHHLGTTCEVCGQYG